MTSKLPGVSSPVASHGPSEVSPFATPERADSESRSSRATPGRSPGLGDLQPRAASASVGVAPSSASVTRALAADELPLAGYLLTCALDGRPVAPPDVARLRRANASVNETRALLRHGRGNVDVDVRATGNETRWRTKAARTQKDQFDGRTGERWVDFTTQATHSAAAASVFGAGNCGEHTSTTAVYHSRRLEEHETVHYVKGKQIGHTWAEARLSASGGSGDRERAIVLDAWADGPAVLASDARFARQREQVRSVLHFDAQRGREARIATNDLVLETRAKGPAEMERRIRSGVTLAARFTAFVDSLLPSGVGDWSAQRVLDDAFIARVRTRLYAPSDSGHVLEQAVRIAQQLGVGDADRPAQALRIVEAARVLVPKR
jgi:hypothetical protein